MIADEKTGIYERKLIRKLLQADQQTNSAYRRLISDVAPILAQYRSSSRGVIINDPDLNRQLSSHIAIFRKRIEDMIRTNQSWAWTLADDKNDQIINEYISNLPISNVAREGLFARNNQAFDNFQKRKYDGLQLSERVWSLGKQNEDLLKDYVDNALITGRTADDLSRDIRELLTEPNRLFRRVRNPKTGKLELSKAAQTYHPGRGMYRSSYMNAKRLARTEINMAYRTSDQERWKSLKFVLGYEVKLSDRHPAPDICDHAAGRYPKEFKFVGWHPQCLCYAVPILPDKKSFLDNLVDDVPLKGEVRDIPESMKQYVSDNLSRISAYKKQPFWVQDNFKGGRIENDLFLDEKRAVIVKSFQNGGEVKIYSRVNRASSDFKDVMRCAEYFAKKGERVDILPKIHHKDNLYTQIFGDLVGTKYAGKCPDMKINGLFYEQEGFVGDNMRNSIRNMLKRGLRQSSRIIISDTGITDNFILRLIRARIHEGQNIDEVWKMNKNGKLKLLFKNTAASQK